MRRLSDAVVISNPPAPFPHPIGKWYSFAVANRQMIQFADANWQVVQFCGRNLAKREKEIDNKGGQMPTFSMRSSALWGGPVLENTCHEW